MHTVTKVLVLFAAVLCVLLAALTMAYSANADAIVKGMRDAQTKYANQEAVNSAIQADFGTQKSKLSEQANSLSTQVTSLQATITQLQGERSQLQSEKKAAEARADDVQHKIDQLGTTADTQAQLIKTYSGEVTKLRENELSWKKREIELADRINELESQREVLEGSVRALQEQLAEARRQIEQGGAAAAQASPGGSREPYTPTFAVAGRVTRVQTDMATGLPVATINIGSNNQVRENMKLAITRGDQFIANVVIRKVDLQWSLGEIDYLSKKNVSVQEGDVVKNLALR